MSFKAAWNSLGAAAVDIRPKFKSAMLLSGKPKFA
jgi:hypothetical protein